MTDPRNTPHPPPEASEPAHGHCPTDPGSAGAQGRADGPRMRTLALRQPVPPRGGPGTPDPGSTAPNAPTDPSQPFPAPSHFAAALHWAADAYTRDIRAAHHLHPGIAEAWPHADFIRWLRVTAGRIGTEPGS